MRIRFTAWRSRPALSPPCSGNATEWAPLAHRHRNNHGPGLVGIAARKLMPEWTDQFDAVLPAITISVLAPILGSLLTKPSRRQIPSAL